MSQVKLKVKLEELEPEEQKHREIQQEPELRGAQIYEDSSVVRFKKEPEEVEIKAEPLEFPLIHESVKREEEEAPFFLPAVKEESREDADGAGLEKLPESEEHGERSSDTDDSEDWAPSAERPASQAHSEGNREESCGSDSESSFEFDVPTKTNSKRKRQMEDYPDGAVQEKQHKCSDCGKVFPYGARLKKHQLDHPHKCSVCGKKFREKQALIIHMRTHTGERPFECSVCSKRFRQIGALHEHMRTHTGEKPHKCSVCGKEFSEKRTLKSHMRTHTGEKPHKCSVCSRNFSAKTSLRRHMKIHTGKRLIND